MRYSITHILLVTAFISSLFSGIIPVRLMAAEVKHVEYYVAPQGKDSWAGTQQRPFATLDGARNAIRALKKRGKLPQGGVTVWVRDGIYPLSSTFALTAEDSGTPEARITYRAFPGEQARIIGGQRIEHFTPVTDPAIFARLDEQARGQVLQADLRAAGITDLGTLKSRGFERPMTPAHLELFFDGKVMQLARWPNDDFVKIAGIPAAAGEGDGHGQTIGKLESGFHYDGERPAHWKATDDIWVHGYWAWDWANTYEHVAAIDTANHLITTQKPYGLYGFRAGQHFYYLNILEELDQPGEYYLDHTTGILYFWPPAPVAKADAFVSVLEAPLVSLQDTSYVTLQGLTFEITRGSAAVVNGGEQNIIGGCTVRNTGNYGVIVEGGTGHRVDGCDIYATGDGGIMMNGGDRKTLTPSGFEAVNNHIHHIGLWSRCYQPGVIVSGVGCHIAHNHIHDGPHTAILINGNDHIIEYNDIHHVCLETGDVGAFYMGRDWTQLGNVVRYNFFHETGGVGMGSMAVYLDDCSSGVTIFGNIFYRTTRAAFIGGGRDNTVENNIFVECNPAVSIDGRGLEKSPGWHDMVYITMKERLDAMDYQHAPYAVRYPKLAELTPLYAKDDGVPPTGNVVAHNVEFGGKWIEINWHAEQQMVEMHDNLVGQDPHFVDAGKLNFQLKDDSPAYALGFKRIPAEEIGLVKDEYRESVQK